jgi:hypothetical protein
VTINRKEEEPTVSDKTIVETNLTHVINAPIERVDIARWLLNIPNGEYQRCCPGAHIAAGTSVADDGRPMSINVEMIGDSLMIQEYVGEVVEPHHCRMVSVSPVFMGQDRTSTEVVWDLRVRRVDDGSCEFANYVKATATDEFLSFLAERGITFDQVVGATRDATLAHNRIETPLFAQSIERYALAPDGEPMRSGAAVRAGAAG